MFSFLFMRATRLIRRYSCTRAQLYFCCMRTLHIYICSSCFPDNAPRYHISMNNNHFFFQVDKLKSEIHAIQMVLCHRSLKIDVHVAASFNVIINGKYITRENQRCAVHWYYIETVAVLNHQSIKEAIARFVLHHSTMHATQL